MGLPEVLLGDLLKGLVDLMDSSVDRPDSEVYILSGVTKIIRYEYNVSQVVLHSVVVVSSLLLVDSVEVDSLLHSVDLLVEDSEDREDSLHSVDLLGEEDNLN